MNYLDFVNYKMRQEKITMITCYDYTSAKILSQTTVDCLLVGDSLAMTMYGFDDTLQANLDMMARHTSAVKRGAPQKFIITDLPFLSYRKSQRHSVEAVLTLMQAGASAVKLEGAIGNLKLIKHLVNSGVPVMGHLGLTPQFLNILGGYKVQAKTHEEQQQLKNAAIQLEKAGVFALVLECVPAIIAAEISEVLTIPVIGIGAGPDTDGQVLVWQDLLGLNIDFKPKFVKHFAEGHQYLTAAINQFIETTKQGIFPAHEHCYHT